MSMQISSHANPFWSNAHLRAVIDRIFPAIEELRERKALRRTLGTLSDHHLRDVGLARYDLEAALNDDLSHPAGSELKAVARRSAASW